MEWTLSTSSALITSDHCVLPLDLLKSMIISFIFCGDYGQVVTQTPPGQMLGHLSVVGLAAVPDKSHHSAVISKFHKGIGRVWRVKRGGLSTPPCGTPVVGIIVDDVGFPILTF